MNVFPDKMLALSCVPLKLNNNNEYNKIKKIASFIKKKKKLNEDCAKRS